jgi:hypothetical protein
MEDDDMGCPSGNKTPEDVDDGDGNDMGCPGDIETHDDQFAANADHMDEDDGRGEITMLATSSMFHE